MFCFGFSLNVNFDYNFDSYFELWVYRNISNNFKPLSFSYQDDYYFKSFICKWDANHHHKISGCNIYSHGRKDVYSNKHNDEDGDDNADGHND
jgi:hypothetical protein